jgi:hypothetical protein
LTLTASPTPVLLASPSPPVAEDLPSRASFDAAEIEAFAAAEGLDPTLGSGPQISRTWSDLQRAAELLAAALNHVHDLGSSPTNWGAWSRRTGEPGFVGALRLQLEAESRDARERLRHLTDARHSAELLRGWLTRRLDAIGAMDLPAIDLTTLDPVERDMLSSLLSFVPMLTSLLDGSIDAVRARERTLMEHLDQIASVRTLLTQVMTEAIHPSSDSPGQGESAVSLLRSALDGLAEVP